MTVDLLLLSLKTGVLTTEGVKHLLAHHALSHVGHLYLSHCTVERSWERWKPTVLDENAIKLPAVSCEAESLEQLVYPGPPPMRKQGQEELEQRNTYVVNRCTQRGWHSWSSKSQTWDLSIKLYGL